MDDSHRDLHLRKAVFGLERYFFLVAFASYITSTDVSPNLQYSEWLQSRAELRNMVERMRKPANSSWIFKPVADLSGGTHLLILCLMAAEIQNDSAFSWRSSAGSGNALGPDTFSRCEARGSRSNRRRVCCSASSNTSRNHIASGDDPKSTSSARLVECFAYAVRAILEQKDIWRDAVEDGPHDASIRGALNFRQIRDTDIYALSQPTDSGIVGVLGQVNSNARDGQSHRTTWVNLREEASQKCPGSVQD